MEGENLDIALRHPFNISVTGTPRLTLDIGGSTVYADYLTGSSTTNIIFRYTIQDGDLDLDGVSIASSLDLNGGGLTYTTAGQINNATTDISSIPSSNSINVDTIGPTLQTMIVPSADTYQLGEQLNFTATMDEATIVTGTPRFPITIGANSRYASYVSGSGSTSLIFSYTIQSDDLDLDGIDISSPIELNSGSLQDSAGNDASLNFTDGNISSVLVDGSTPAPEVIALTVPTDNTYTEGETLDFSIQFSESVNVSGTPRLSIQLTSGTIYANYLSGSSTDTLNFQYTILANDSDSDGIGFQSTSVDLNSGTIIGVSSAENADLDFSSFVPSLVAVTVESTPTQLVITSQPTDTLEGDNIAPAITIEVRNSAGVLVDTATNLVTVSFGTDPSAGAAVLGGTLSVNAIAGVATFSNITIDTANNGYTFDFTSTGLTNSISNTFNITSPVPTVTIDTLSVINTNNVSSYTVTGTCSEDTRTVTLDVGGVAATPTCSSGVYNSGALDLSGVADSPSVLVTADHDNAAATPATQATQNVVKDTDVPDISANTITANSYALGETVTIDVTFDQNVIVTGLPRIELMFESQSSANIYAIYNGGSGTNTLSFDYTVAAGDADANGINLASSIDLNSGTIQDVNSNDAVLTLSTSFFGSVFVDSAVPSIVEFIEPVDGTYPDGVGLLFQVNFNELVNITGTPRIAINIGGTTRYATYQTGTGTTGLEFEYIVQPGDADADGISLVANSIELNGGTIKAADTDDAVLDFTLYADAMPGVIVDTATGITPPDQVTGLTPAPTTSNTELALSWAIPNDNGTAITSYAVQYREQGQSTWITLNPAPTTNSTTVTGLSSGVTYEFRVAANNGLLGPFSTISTAEIFDVLSLDPIAWLDATNVNGNGTSPADGVNVATWVDLTGAASNATEANVANQPVMEYNAQNGLPAVRFDNHAVGLEGSFTRSNGTDLTFIIVGQFDNGFTDKCMMEFQGSGSARGFFIDRRYASNTFYSPALTQGSFQMWRIENDGASAVITENSSTELFNGSVLFNTNFTGTGNYVLGDDATGGNRLNGYIAEFLVFDRALTAQEISTLEQYLKNKWGTP